LGRADYYSVQVTAWLQIRTSGAYTFFLGVDDNMRLIIDGTVVGSSTCCGKYDPFTVNLAAGYRRVVVQYINYGGNGYGVLHPRCSALDVHLPAAAWCASRHQRHRQRRASSQQLHRQHLWPACHRVRRPCAGQRAAVLHHP
jgi:hypothetical protein